MSCAVRPSGRLSDRHGIVPLAPSRRDGSEIKGELPLIGVGFAEADEEKDQRLLLRQQLAVVIAWAAALVFVVFAIAVAWGFSR